MSRAKSKRMQRIFKMQSRKEEQQRAVVAVARQQVESDRRELDAIETQVASINVTPTGSVIDLGSVQFGRLLVESGMRASAHRRTALDESLARLDEEYELWHEERRRANSLEKLVDRLAREAIVEQAKAEELQIEELSMSRRVAQNRY